MRCFMRIGVFDSGIGGINVLASLIKKYPHNEYIYFGDTKNLPYGDKDKDELLQLACSAIDFLLTKNVDIIIVACGTISCVCYSDLRKKYDVPIYDVITPTINYLKESSYHQIGVIGTTNTIKSGIFNIPGKNVFLQATPNLVPIIENNQIFAKEKEIEDSIAFFKDKDVLVLGCTHYPLIKPICEKMNIKTLDMGEILSETLNLSDNGKYLCELYFSLISVNLITNINNILKSEYQIYPK